MPNIMVLQYLKKTGGSSPAVLMKAEEYVRQGYQRLLTFEVPGGGFSWFGRSPANVMLSAYGLFEFAEMARVIPVDEKVLQRTRAWLLSRRAADGHFEEEVPVHSLRVHGREYALTAFVTWAMLSAGATAGEVAPSVEYLLRGLPAEEDPYAQSLVLNALVRLPERRAQAGSLAGRLARIQGREGWTPRERTLVDSRGEAGSVEVASFLALGLLELRTELAAARSATRFILGAKAPDGTWQTTTATVLALKALLAELECQGVATPFSGTVAVSVNGRQAGEIAVSDRNYDVVQQLDLKEFTRTGDHTIALDARLSSPQVFSVQAVSSYYVPWDGPASAPGAEGPLVARQTFDRTTLAVDDRIKARVELEYRASPSGSLVLLDLGIPPGFAVEPGDLDGLVSQQLVSRWELAGRQLILYLPPLAQNRPVVLEYRLRAKYPVRAATPPSTAYEYYNPENRVHMGPVQLEVR